MWIIHYDGFNYNWTTVAVKVSWDELVKLN